MAHRLGVSRSSLLMKHLREPCPPKFAEDVIRRQAHEPVSYIVGFQEFYGLPFAVGPGVLIPRPDSEVLVETSLEIAGESGHVLDLGTGSGALLLAFLANRPGWIGTGIDQSETALEYAKRRMPRPWSFKDGAGSAQQVGKPLDFGTRATASFRS